MSAEKPDDNRDIAQLLLSELQRQAIKGGAKKPIIMSDSTSETAAGPYWQRENWNNYCNNLIGLLVNSYGYSREEAEKAVKEKSKGVILWD